MCLERRGNEKRWPKKWLEKREMYAAVDLLDECQRKPA
jgi:hypothetical protein